MRIYSSQFAGKVFIYHCHQPVLTWNPRFHEFTGQYPSNITVISHNFKRGRFTRLHRAALRIPEANFNFVGIDPPGEISKEGELNSAVVPFSADPYGCFDQALVTKRVERNPFRRRTPYFESVSCHS